MIRKMHVLVYLAVFLSFSVIHRVMVYPRFDKMPHLKITETEAIINIIHTCNKSCGFYFNLLLGLSSLIRRHSLKKSRNRSSSSWDGGYSANQDHSSIQCGVRSTWPQTARVFLQISWKQPHSADL